MTIDAIGCQPRFAAQIVEQGADYMLTGKANQGSLWQEAQQCFAVLTDEMTFSETDEMGYGRHKLCGYRMTEWLPIPWSQIRWKGLRSLGMVEAIRTMNDKPSVERRYFISRLPVNAQRLTEAVRGHWGIENQVRWILDVVFDEDYSWVWERQSAANVALIWRSALNILQGFLYMEERRRAMLN